MPNRSICSVLEEIRKCYETRNFSYLLGLVEEAQTLANIMESSVYDKHDVEALKARRRQLKAEVKALKKKKRKLGGGDERI